VNRQAAAAARHAAVAGAALLIVAAGLRDVPGVRRLGQPLRPLAELVGLDQNWRIFAPEPRRASLQIEAVVLWSDGTQTVWKPPYLNRSLGAYRDYRWRKWLEHVSRDSEGQRLWPALARFVLHTHRARAGATPRELRLRRLVRRTNSPGERAGPSAWQVFEVYNAELASRSP